eukprot:334311_1
MALPTLVAFILRIVTSETDGSGVFGLWNETSPFNLPFYTYTLDQTTNTNATAYNDNQLQTVSSDTNATNHLFQFGNDKYVVIASNYGFTQMRTDETGPKFLNDFNRNNYQYGGANGYVNINNTIPVLSTFYTGNKSSNIINRNYGFYYRNYYIKNKIYGISLNQTVISPFGNDTVTISQIKIRSSSNSDTVITYSEVYSNTMYQQTDGASADTRRNYQINNYNVSYKNIAYFGNTGLQSMTMFEGNKSANGQWLYDENLPITFLSTIGVNTNTNIEVKCGCELNRFYGNGGAESPDFDVECSGENNIKYTGLILELSNINIPANSEVILYLIYGYVYNEVDIKTLINKYNDMHLLTNLTYDTAYKWSKDAFIFNTNNTKYQWMSREILWNYGYLRSSLTFYNLYNEYILDQGTAYRYWDGFQGAFRDPLQHSLPLIYTNPEYVKSIIRYSLKEIISPFNDTKREYNVPYGLEGNGIILNATISTAPSDLELYLLFVVSEYILSTQDTDFLHEKVYLNIFGENKEYSVLDCLLESYNFLRQHIAVGKHGVIRIQTGDWNDAILFGNGNYADMVKNGESGLNTPFSLYVLPKFKQILDMINYSLPDLPNFINNQTNVLQTQLWNGEYINRAWVPTNSDNTKGYWLGSLTDGQMFLFPQVWTLLCGEKCLSKDKINVIVDNIDKRLRNNATIGAIMLWNSTSKIDPGELTNGGSWYAINYPLVMALATVNGSMALDEWIRNSFNNKANLYPTFWPNIWSSGDSVASYLVSNASAVGTSDWPNYPVFCLHSHAWPLYSFVNGILGITFHGNELVIKPSLNHDFGAFEFKTKLISLKRDDKNNYYGIYCPKQFIKREFVISLDLRLLDSKLDKYTESIEVNGDCIYWVWKYNERKFHFQNWL